MGWRDRPYSGGDDPGGGYGRSFGDNPLAWAPSIGTAFGIRIQIHILFILYIAIQLLRASMDGGFWWEFRFLFMLFGLVLLHEFGHCFGARHVGGTASQILMWPLGGLAYVAPPHRPGAHFFTALAGPLVNVAGCVLAAGVLVAATGTFRAVPINPFHMYPPADVIIYLMRSDALFWVYQFFYVNYILLLFNCCLPMYPLDGGRMFQAACWHFMGYGRSMRVATTVGMIGAVLLGCYGLFTQNFLLIGIAVFGYITSMRERQSSAEGYAEPLYETGTPRPRRSLFGFRKGAWERKQKRLAEEQAEVDRILLKVHREGLQSLTRKEKKTLARATQRQRERERELDRVHRF
jgi:stage IV sporulation protein FB